MHKYAPKLKELAPRDLVARAIYQESTQGPIFLNITHKPTEFIKKRFPKIYKELRHYKLNPSRDLLPVTPAAHYICGGIKTDLKGRTSLKRLYAFGECAYTGVHGANRLASNSLLEALVFSNQVADNIRPLSTTKLLTPPQLKLTSNKELIHTAQKARKKIREIMWYSCGIVRTPAKIKEGLALLQEIANTLEKALPHQETNRQIQEAKNLLKNAQAVLNAAQKRKKSLGAHFVE